MWDREFLKLINSVQVLVNKLILKIWSSKPAQPIENHQEEPPNGTSIRAPDRQV